MISLRYSSYINSNLFDLLDVINLFRIRPYLTNKDHDIILDRLIKSTSIYEKFNCAYGGKII
mgnify:FL=1